MGSIICCLTNPEISPKFPDLSSRSQKEILTTKLVDNNYQTTSSSEYEEFGFDRLTLILKNLEAFIPEFATFNKTAQNQGSIVKSFDLPNSDPNLVILQDKQISAWGEKFFSQGWNIQITRIIGPAYSQYSLQLSVKYLVPVSVLDSIKIVILYRCVPFFIEDCIICEDEKSNQAILPCGHVCLCANCAQTNSSKLKKCPLCETQIQKIQSYGECGFRKRILSN